MTEQLWNLPTKPGTVIAIGEWWLVRLRSYEGAPPGWEMLPANSREVGEGMARIGVQAQRIYADEWVLAEADQDGGYYVVSEPPSRPYGPHIRIREDR